MPFAATLAGLLAVVTGLLPLDAARGVLDRAAPVLGFLVAITLVAELADEARLFDVTARGAALVARGSLLRLFLLVCLIAAAITTVLSLDTTAVLLTPVVLALSSAVNADPLPFAFAAVWLANTASLLLPVSNLTNLLAEQQLGFGASRFAALTSPVQVALLVVTVGVLLLRYRSRLRGRYASPDQVPVEDKPLLWVAAGVCLAVGPGVVLGAPAWSVATVGAAVLVTAYAVRRPAAVNPKRVVRLLPWRLVVMTIELFLVVETLHKHGLTRLAGHVAGTSGNDAGHLLRLAGVSAVVANAVNNLPAYLAVEPLAHTQERLVAVLIGVNAGPLILLWGSLASLLWRERCAARGVRIGAAQFAREGLLLAPLAVVVATLAIHR